MTLVEQLREVLRLVKEGLYASYTELELKNPTTNGNIEWTNLITFWRTNQDGECRQLASGDIVRLRKEENNPIRCGMGHTFCFDDEDDIEVATLLREIRLYFRVLIEPFGDGGYQKHNWCNLVHKPSWLREQPYGRGLPND